MVEVAKTTDPVRLGYLRAALGQAGIECFAFDDGAGALWPGAFPNRLMVEDKDAWRARIVIEKADADVGD